jgi:uncharacterized protein (DUF433 family)
MMPEYTANIPLERADNGKIYVIGTRVSIDIILTDFKNGASAEEIVHRYSVLRLPDVYAVLTYYLQNTAQIEAYLQQQADLSARLRADTEKRSGVGNVRARLLARKR